MFQEMKFWNIEVVSNTKINKYCFILVDVGQCICEEVESCGRVYGVLRLVEEVKQSMNGMN